MTKKANRKPGAPLNEANLAALLAAQTLDVDGRHKIIVGVDYGTTFSGVSYVTTDKNDIDDINIITKWPGDTHTSWKTPTRIAYQQENPQLPSNKWGFEVGPKLTSYSWTKLLLDKNAAAAQHDDPALFQKMSNEGMMRLPRFRDAPGVCQDFLTEVFQHVSAKLSREMTEHTFNQTPMECWITLPAIWSDEAKDSTLQAAKRAGFGNRPGDEIFTIAEPEAAAIATLKKYTGAGVDTFNPVMPSENILILDCGGGTVDITTYTITQVEPRLDFEELCVGIGGKCGSTYIDRALHELLFARFGDAFKDVPWAQKGPGSKLMACFEGIKRDFGLKDDEEERELGPINLGLPDSKYYDEEERLVKLSYNDMLQLFDPVIGKITKLVEQQVHEAKTVNNSTINRIILVGGFGESPYLFKELGKWCRRNGGIALMCPENPQAAVVRGAALRGLEGVAPRMKRARRHYGIGVSMRFREGIDPEEFAYLDDFDDAKRCTGRIDWLIAKGEKVFSDTSRKIHVSTNCTLGKDFVGAVTLYSCGLADAPEYYSDPRVEKIGKISYTIGKFADLGSNIRTQYNPRLSKMVQRIPHEVHVIFGDKGENLKFSTVLNGVVHGTATIDFSQR